MDGFLTLTLLGGRAGGREAATKFSSQEKEEERERVSPTPLPFPSPTSDSWRSIHSRASLLPSFPSPSCPRERRRFTHGSMGASYVQEIVSNYIGECHTGRRGRERDGRGRRRPFLKLQLAPSFLPLPPSCSGRLFPSPHLSAFWSGEKFADTAGRKREERRGMAEGKVAEEEAKRWGKEKGCRESLPSFL